jgi:HK97 gp10 family phage protein
MITSMRATPKTGRKYKRGRKIHIASSPNKPPAIDTGQLIRSITMDDRLREVEVGATSGAPYASYLEEGTKRMKKRPFLLPAVEKEMPKVQFRIRQRVRKIIREMGRV